MLGGAINPKNKKANFLSSFEEELGQQGADIAKAKAEVVPQKSEVAPQKSPEGAGSTWDFLPDFSNYVPDFSDYVPDVSGPTAQGLFGALANFGGIAGALATGGPQAMSAFVNRIAESQQLELSREWEAFQKNEDKAFTLHRDRLQREHEAALHEKKESAIQKRVADKGTNGLISRWKLGTKEEQNAKIIHAFTSAGLEGRAQDFIAARDKGDVATQTILAGQVWTNLGDAVPDIAKAGDLVARSRQTVIDYVGKDNIGHIAAADFPILAVKIANEKKERSAKQQVLKGKVDSIAGRIDATEDPNELRLASRELDEVGKSLAQEQSPVTGIEGLETKAGTFGRNVSADEMLLTGLIQQNYEGVQSKLGLKLDSVNYAANQGSLSKEITGGQKILETGIALDLLDGPTDPKKVTKAIAAIGQSVTDPLTRLIDVDSLIKKAGTNPENLTALPAEALEAIRLLNEHFVDPTTGELYAEGDTDSLEFSHERIIQLFSDVKGDLSQQHSDERAKLLAGGIFDKILMGANSIDTTSLSAELTKRFDTTATKKTTDDLSKTLGIPLDGLDITKAITYAKSANTNLGISFRNPDFAKSLSKQQDRQVLEPNKFLRTPGVTNRIVAKFTRLPEGLDISDSQVLDDLSTVSDNKLASAVTKLVAAGQLGEEEGKSLHRHWRNAAKTYMEIPSNLIRTADAELIEAGVSPQVLVSVNSKGAPPPDAAAINTIIDRHATTRQTTPTTFGQAVAGASDVGEDDVAVFEDVIGVMSGNADYTKATTPMRSFSPAQTGRHSPTISEGMGYYPKTEMRDDAIDLWPHVTKIYGNRVLFSLSPEKFDQLHVKVRQLEMALNQKIRPRLGASNDRGFVQENLQEMLRGLPPPQLVKGVLGDPTSNSLSPMAIPKGISLEMLRGGGDPIEIPGATSAQADPQKTQAMIHVDNLAQIRDSQRNVVALGKFMPGGSGWSSYVDAKGAVKIMPVTPAKLQEMSESLLTQEKKAEAKLYMTGEAGAQLMERSLDDFDAFLFDINGKFCVELDAEGNIDHAKTEANILTNTKAWGSDNLGGVQKDPAMGVSLANAATNALIENLGQASSESGGAGSVAMLQYLFGQLKLKTSTLYKQRGGSASVNKTILKDEEGGLYIEGELIAGLDKRKHTIQALTTSSRLRNMNSGALKEDIRRRMSNQKALEVFDNMKMDDISAPYLKSILFEAFARAK